MIKVAGFTLIEMALVTLIIGVLMGAASSFYLTYDTNRRLEITRENLKIGREALTDYQDTMGAYPIPARRNLSVGQGGYGESAVLDALGTPVLGGCINTDDINVGLCRVSGRDVDGDGAPEDVLIGAVPINSMIPNLTNAKLSRNNIIDGWGNILKYAVSRDLTNPGNFSSSAGAITIQDEFGTSLTDPDGSAHFVLISHGDNGGGSFTLSGGQYNDCPINRVESENCDDNDAVFVSGLRAMADTANYNDDLVRYLSWKGASIWNYSADGENIHNTNIGNIGIGTEEPAERLQVVGVIKAQDALAQAFCDNVGTDCMNPDAIAGDLPDMECPAGQVAVGVELNRLVCAAPAAGVASSTCAAGTLAVGYSTKNGLICQAF